MKVNASHVYTLFHLSQLSELNVGWRSFPLFVSGGTCPCWRMQSRTRAQTARTVWTSESKAKCRWARIMMASDSVVNEGVLTIALARASSNPLWQSACNLAYKADLQRDELTRITFGSHLSFILSGISSELRQVHPPGQSHCVSART